jgi:hypothetical protein
VPKAGVDLKSDVVQTQILFRFSFFAFSFLKTFHPESN